MTEEDYVRALGVTALGTRLRRFFERLNGPVTALYRRELGFEQRWFALTLLLQARGPCAVGEAAARLGVSHPAVLQAASAMEARGLVSKTRDPADARSSLLALTPKGARVANKVNAVSRRVDAAATALLAEAAPDLLQNLDALEDALGRRSFAERLQGAGADDERPAENRRRTIR